MAISIGMIGSGLFVSHAEAAVAYVQGKGVTSANCGGASEVTSSTFTSGNTAHNLIVLAFVYGGQPAANPVVSDSNSNTYFHATGVWDAVKQRGLDVYYAVNVASGANTVTVTLGASGPSNCRLAIHEYSGVATTTPVLDMVSANMDNNGTTTTDGVTSGAATTRTDGELIFGAVENDGGASPITAATGTAYTRQISVNSDELVTEYRVQASASSTAAAFTDSTSTSYLAAMVTFRAAGASFAQSGPTYIQGNSGYDSRSGGCGLYPDYATNVRFPTANLAGDLIVVTLSYGGLVDPAQVGADNDIVITDSQGNTYAQAAMAAEAVNNRGLAVYYAQNIKAGVNTTTVSFPNNQLNCCIVIQEYSGVATSAPAIDVAAMNTSGAGTVAVNGATSGAGATRTSGALIFGAAENDGARVPFVSAGGGFTARSTAYSGEMLTEDQVISSTSSVAATFTDSTSTSYLAAMVAFRAAGVSYPNTNPTWVQSNGQSSGGFGTCPGNNMSTAFAAPNIAGDLIVVAVSNGNASVVPSLSDTNGNTYKQATPYMWNSGQTQGMVMFYAQNVASGTSINTVNANFATASTMGYCAIGISEYAAVATTSPLVAVTVNQQYGVVTTSTDAVTSDAMLDYVAGDLVVGALEVDNAPHAGTTLAGTGFSQRAKAHDDEFILEDKLITTPGMISARGGGTFRSSCLPSRSSGGFSTGWPGWGTRPRTTRS